MSEAVEQIIRLLDASPPKDRERLERELLIHLRKLIEEQEDATRAIQIQACSQDELFGAMDEIMQGLAFKYSDSNKS